jgi:hypothetical protein
MPTHTSIFLNELLAQLEIAVRANDRPRALELSRKIQQRLATDAAENASVERQMRALLAELDAPRPTVEIAERVDFRVLDVERDSTPVAGDTVYPVWFGTNREPAADGVTFTNTRHAGTTRGRVLVNVPEAHRFGETGNAFWKRLLRFDLRDDRLRIQATEQRERDTFFAEIHSAMQAARDTGGAPHALFFCTGLT